MKNILLAGGTGLVGSRLTQILQENGYKVAHLSRKTARPESQIPTFLWNVETQTMDEKAIEWADAVINLAGAGITEKRWTTARKRELIESRTHSARLLKSAFLKTGKRPSAYLAASAIGFYGHRFHEILNEESPVGTGFLAECTQKWEAATNEIAALGIRTVKLRIGVVLSTRGGALVELMKPTRFGIAPIFNGGESWYSWIHVDDLCRQFLFVLESEHLDGTFNAVAPNSLKIKELSREIAAALHRNWALPMPVPTFGLRFLLGEMADVVLNSDRVSSEKIEAAGFRFQFSEAGAALKDLMEKRI